MVPESIVEDTVDMILSSDRWMDKVKPVYPLAFRWAASCDKQLNNLRGICEQFSSTSNAFFLIICLAMCAKSEYATQHSDVMTYQITGNRTVCSKCGKHYPVLISSWITEGNPKHLSTKHVLKLYSTLVDAVLYAKSLERCHYWVSKVCGDVFVIFTNQLMTTAVHISSHIL